MRKSNPERSYDMAGYDFFQNKSCEYFPCHKTTDIENFSCLFCYCPLYALGENCGGNFKYTQEGIKDCSDCMIPHRRDNYAIICKKLSGIVELAKKPKKP